MVLERIVNHKRLEVAERMKRRPREKMGNLEPSSRSLKEALVAKRCGFILECKKASPSRGLIRPVFNPVSISHSYAPFADGISVITDNRFFEGRLEYIRKVSNSVKQPVLCKDFIIDPYQIYEARSFGADAVLLMFSVLSDEEIGRCAAAAASLDLDVLAEVHDGTELKRALRFDLPIIGINNRNLKTLEVDLSVTEELAPRVPSTRVVVAESGVSTHRDVLRLRSYVDGFLVGSSLMEKKNIDVACRELVHGPVKVCGLTRPEDAEAAWRSGAVYGGLIFAEKSPRLVDEATARKVRDVAPLTWVGVFVNDDIDRIASLVDTLDLGAVQLHGEESPEYVEELRKRIPLDREIWKAVRIGEHIPTAVDETGADRILLDTFKRGVPGGTGERFDWSLLKGRDLSSVILSGGLSPEVAAEADAMLPFALDVNSGVEVEPGVKSADMLADFFAVLRGVGRSGGLDET
ncbi:MAG: bifunctional indole-3-glycerol-phosphate synthase TrpC/phosphoribosylanthranilate isomerase TrpF [Deltaproteobacteria bacterium]|nr:bifunctional indole-3-glycerol-phosphate synthase TrpC/phosphoribosylanthranilate isomerase TrpF [Deltaproteobacteria bacterium]